LQINSSMARSRFQFLSFHQTETSAAALYPMLWLL